MVPEFLGWLLWNILKCLQFYVHTITGNFVGLEFIKTSLSLYYFKRHVFFKWFDWEAISSMSSVNSCVVNRKVWFLDSITMVPQNWLAALYMPAGSTEFTPRCFCWPSSERYPGLSSNREEVTGSAVKWQEIS